MRKLILIFVILTQAHAGTWQEFARDSDNNSYEFDASLVTKHDNAGKVLVVWTRTQNKTAKTTTKYELHCGSRSYRIIVMGRQWLGGEYYQEDKDSRWRYAFPDSVEMSLIDYTCYYFR